MNNLGGWDQEAEARDRAERRLLTGIAVIYGLACGAILGSVIFLIWRT